MDIESRKKYAREYYKKNREKEISYQMAYERRHPEAVKARKLKWSRTQKAKDKQKERFAKWYKEHGKIRHKKELESIYKWQREHKLEMLVSIELRQAVKAGKIIKPEFCSRCGQKKILLGHHTDYSKPLEVMWLCYSCHKILHNTIIDILQ